MASVSFNPPRQWEDWVSWLLGIWLCLSPWALRFDTDSTATHAAVISGILIIAAEIITLSVFSLWEEWINVVLGAWIVAAPWLLHLKATAITVNFVVVGALLFALAIYELQHPGRPEKDG